MTAGNRRTARSSGSPVSADEIYQAALTLFSRHSFAQIGMREISDAVGIRSGSLYAHIGSKEELLQRIVRDGINNYLVELLPIANKDTPAPERMRDAIRKHVDVLAKTPSQTTVAFNQWQFLGEDAKLEIIGLRLKYEEIFTRIISDGVSEGSFRPLRDQRIAVIAVIGMLTYAGEWFVRETSTSSDEFGHSLAEAAVDGLLND